MAGGGESAEPEPVLDGAATDMTVGAGVAGDADAASQPARRRGAKRSTTRRTAITGDVPPRRKRGQMSEVERLAAKVTDDFQELVSAWKRQAKEKERLRVQLDEIRKAVS
jgi:hypothetical protein